MDEYDVDVFSDILSMTPMTPAISNDIHYDEKITDINITTDEMNTKHNFHLIITGKQFMRLCDENDNFSFQYDQSNIYKPENVKCFWSINVSISPPPATNDETLPITCTHTKFVSRIKQFSVQDAKIVMMKCQFAGGGGKRYILNLNLKFNNGMKSYYYQWKGPLIFRKNKHKEHMVPQTKTVTNIPINIPINIHSSEKVITHIYPRQGTVDTRVYIFGVNLQCNDNVLFGDHIRQLCRCEHDTTKLYVYAPYYDNPKTVIIKLLNSNINCNHTFEYTTNEQMISIKRQLYGFINSDPSSFQLFLDMNFPSISCDFMMRNLSS